jgi:DNA-binding transcriptional LysR family regulator
MRASVDLRQLRNLISVIENGSLGKAAEALHISQPALTKSIQRLEERLGVQLFYRDSRGMRPTVYGDAFRAHAQGVMIGVEQALMVIEALKAGSEGIIKVAAPPLMTDQILADATLILTKEQPGLRVNITTEIGDATADLLAGEYDFILTLLTTNEPTQGLRQRLLFNDRVALIVRVGHPLTRLPIVRARDLRSYSWVLPLPGHFHRRRLEGFFEAEGLVPPQAGIECSSTSFIKEIVCATDRIGLVARMGLTLDLPGSKNVTELRTSSPFMVRPLGLAWREHNVLAKSSLRFIEAIEGVCRQKKFLDSGDSKGPRGGRDRKRAPSA